MRMIDEVIDRSRKIPPYVTRAQTGPLVLPYGSTYFIHGYASDALYDAHFDLYGADRSDGYVYLFRIDSKAKHFSPYMFFKGIHRGLRKYDEQDWWREEWASKENLDYYLWNQLELGIDEYDKSFVTTRGVPEMEIRSLDDLSEEGSKILELYADYANLPIEVAAKKIEHFLELRHSGLGYIPNVNENAFYSALVDLGYGGLYEWEYEMPDFPLNFLILDPSIIESYKVVRAKDVPPDVDMGDYLNEQPWVPADFPRPPPRSNPLPDTVRVQFSKDGYLINPEDGSDVWWHGSRDEFVTFSSGGVGYDGMFFASSESEALKYFVKTSIDSPYFGDLLKVRIKKCHIFDPRDYGHTDISWEIYDELYDKYIEDFAPYKLQERGFDGYIETDSHQSREDFTFNVCIFDARRFVELVEQVNYRPNPALRVDSGYLVNPETNDTYWFHGSWTGRKRKFDWNSPRKDVYPATFFTSDEDLAVDFATGERVWLDIGEDPPPMKRTGYLHRVKIKDVPLVDADKLFVDRDALTLSEEGVLFIQSLQNFGASDSEIESFTRTLSEATYHAFGKRNNPIWPYLIRTIVHLGYRGWFERESIHRSHTNIGLLYPDEDARVWGGYTVKRTRRL